jgi:hypothetical protein
VFPRADVAALAPASRTLRVRLPPKLPRAFPRADVPLSAFSFPLSAFKFFASTTAPHRRNAILKNSVHSVSNGIARGISSHKLPKVGGVGNPALPIGTMRFRLACPDNLVNPVFVRHVLLLAIPPVTGFTTTVHHRKYKNPIRTDRKKDCVWKY